MTAFNQTVFDAPSVEYRSYAGIIGTQRIVQEAVLGITQPLFVLDGANDGWVSFRSAHWREFKGTLRADHAELIGYDLSPAGLFPFGFASMPFDHLDLYRRIADDLVPLGE
jgi:triacylglycerol lipase